MRAHRRRRIRRWLRVPLALLLLVTACTAARGPGGGEPLHLSEVGREGDAARRASVRLCLLGLEADEGGRSSLAESHYERAIQIDPTNPFAYLALARHALEVGEPVRALEYLNQAEVLLESQAARSPRVEPHLAGLRGAAMRMDGRGGDDLLDAAARLSPSVWSDGELSAAELR